MVTWQDGFVLGGGILIQGPAVKNVVITDTEFQSGAAVCLCGLVAAEVLYVCALTPIGLTPRDVPPWGTRVLISLWDSLMFGRVPGTRTNISESHSEISTRVPFCIATCSRRPPHRKGTQRQRSGG